MRGGSSAIRTSSPRATAKRTSRATPLATGGVFRRACRAARALRRADPTCPLPDVRGQTHGAAGIRGGADL